MQQDNDGKGGKPSDQPGKGETRVQQAGEAETTRFGMEDGDNTDIPATGGPTADEGEGERPA